jgi:hypothetical protein
MKTLKFYKAIEVQLPIWVNGEATDEKETRISVILRQETSALGGFLQVKNGSFIAMRGYTVEQVNADFADTDDLSAEFALEDREGSDFAKVVAL